MIEYPDKDYVYWHTNSQRHNDVRREAMQTCQRNETLDRLAKLGIQKLYVPQLTIQKPDDAHTVVLTPPPAVLRQRKRVIVLINDSMQDLGILAYRSLQRELGINGGSLVNFVKHVITRSWKTEDGVEVDIDQDGSSVDHNADTPGLVVMNCGQLLFSYKLQQPLSLRSWSALPRTSMCHDQIEIMDENHVPGNRDANEHIKFVMDNVIKNSSYVSEDAEVYVIAIENGAESFVDVLQADLDRYGTRITAMAFINPFVVGEQIVNARLKAFLHQRARQWNVASGSNNPKDCIEAPSQYVKEMENHDGAEDTKAEAKPKPSNEGGSVSWLENFPSQSSLQAITHVLKRMVVSDKPATVPTEEALEDRDQMDPICPIFADAANPQGAGECVFTSPEVQAAILDFFEEVAQDPHHYRNPIFRAPITSSGSGWASEEHTDNAGTERAGDAMASGFEALQVADETTPERIELDTKRDALRRMHITLGYTPQNVPELQAGRENLERRIVKLEGEVRELATKALAAGGLKKGEDRELRENWKPVNQGPKMMFAGAMVDSELVKGAGLFDTAEEGLAETGQEGQVED